MEPRLPVIVIAFLVIFFLVRIFPPFLVFLSGAGFPGPGPVSPVLAAGFGDVVINEVAWMGTEASSHDEWIELFNTTDAGVDLSGWALQAADGTPDITLSATIAAAGFYLLERTDDTTVRDVPVNLVYKRALGNGGEHLRLKDASGGVVDEVNCSEGWFAGDNILKRTMERVAPEASGSAKLNWDTNDGKTINGQDAGGHAVMGTPKAQNSVYGKPPQDEEPDGEVKIDFNLPAVAIAGESFAVSVSAQNLEPRSDYWTRFLAAPAGGKFYDGRTRGADGETYLAWNAAWEKMPRFTTGTEGGADSTLQAKIKEGAAAGDYEVRIRVRLVGNGGNIDSEVRSLRVEEAEPSDSSGDEIFGGTIAEIRGREKGAAVRVRGFVTVPPGVFGDDVFYLRDDPPAGARAGIRVVYYTSVLPLGVGLGDEVELGCTIEESYDELYIKMAESDSLAVLRAGLSAPEPEAMATGAIDESSEGRLVKLFGAVVETSGATFWIDDGSGRVKIYIKDSTGIDTPYKRVGYEAEVVGIVSQWGFLKDGEPNYRVMPRFQDDLQVSAPEEAAVEEDLAGAGGEILGVSALPVTGVPGLQFLLAEVWLCFGAALRLFLYVQKESLLQG